jgi:formate hydrogenlyase transcriptional activator
MRCVWSTAQRYETLLQVNQAALTRSTPQEVFAGMCGSLKRVLAYDRAGLMLYEPEEDNLRVAALDGSLPDSYFRLGVRINRKESPHGLAFERQRAIIRQDVEKEAQFAIEARTASEGLHSYCAVPLVVRGSSIGVVTMLSFRAKQYGERHAQFLQEACNQIVLALKSFMFYCSEHQRTSLICPRCIGSSGGQKTAARYHEQLSNWGKQGGRGRKKAPISS